MPPKNESPPSTLNALTAGVDVTSGSGPVEKYGPAIFGILYVALLALPIFYTPPNLTAYSVLLGVVGPIGFSWISKLGVTSN